MGSKGSTQTTTYKMPTWQEGDWQGLINQANGQANADISSVNYPGIQGQFNSTSTNILNNQVNPTQLASGITSAASPAWNTAGTASSYMSPYENTALTSQVNLDRNTLLNPELAQTDVNAAASGALGGDRDQVLKSQLMNNFNNTEANTIAQGENSAYNTGLGAFENDASRQLQGAESAAQTNLAGANSNVYANFAAGQNALNQIAASEAPEQQLAQESGILAGMPKEGQQQTVQSPNGGMFGGIASGVLGGVGQLLTGIGSLAKGGLVEDAPKKKRKRKRYRSKKGKK